MMEWIKEYQTFVGSLITGVIGGGTLIFAIIQYKGTQKRRVNATEREAFLARHLDGGLYSLIDSITHQAIIAINTILRIQLTKAQNPNALSQTVDELKPYQPVQALLCGNYPDVNKALARLNVSYLPVHYVIVNGMATITQVMREVFVAEGRIPEGGNPERFIGNLYLFITSILDEMSLMMQQTQAFDGERRWLLDHPSYKQLHESCLRFRDLHQALQSAGEGRTQEPANELNKFIVDFRDEKITAIGEMIAK